MMPNENNLLMNSLPLPVNYNSLNPNASMSSPPAPLPGYRGAPLPHPHVMTQQMDPLDGLISSLDSADGAIDNNFKVPQGNLKEGFYPGPHPLLDFK
jgi:hypothetical protein